MKFITTDRQQPIYLTSVFGASLAGYSTKQEELEGKHINTLKSRDICRKIKEHIMSIWCVLAF